MYTFFHEKVLPRFTVNFYHAASKSRKFGPSGQTCQKTSGETQQQRHPRQGTRHADCKVRKWGDKAAAVAAAAHKTPISHLLIEK